MGIVGKAGVIPSGAAGLLFPGVDKDETGRRCAERLCYCFTRYFERRGNRG